MKKRKEQLLQKRNAELKKQLEQKKHELKIEAALEKVRAVAMRMKKPADLLNICETLYKQFVLLGFSEMRNAMINIQNDANKSFINYDYSDEIGKSTNYLTYSIHPLVEKQIKQIQKTKDAFSETYFTGKDLVTWKKFRKKIGEKNDPRVNKSKGLYYYFYSIGIGAIGISTFGPISKEKKELLKRFRNVFNLSYKRYVDISKAEAQAREAEIELALERVRARTMAMHRSEELKETTLVLFQQFKLLGATTAQVSICIFDDEARMGEMFVTLKGEKIDRSFPMELDKEVFVMKKAQKAFLDKQKTFSCSITGKELQKYNQWRNLLTGGKRYDESDAVRKQAWHVNAVFFSRGMMGISSETPASYEAIKLLERFAKVFDLTFTRFLDLQKAEAQAREAQIEASLERVRSRTMAMHQTSELQEVIHTVHKELLNLNLSIDGGSFVVINEDVGPGLRCWGSGGTANTSEEVQVPDFNLPFVINLVKGIKKGPGFFTEEFSQQEKKEYFTKLFKHKPWSGLSSARKKATLSSPGGYTRSVAVSKYTSIFIINHQGRKFTEAENEILKRFAKVFEQTYTRFLDLQKAEAQTRESQIQLALERVRARTMAMQRSDELPQAASLLFQQVQSLGMPTFAAGYCIWDDDKKGITLWMSSEGILQPPFKAPTTEDELFIQMRKGYEDGRSLHVVEMGGEELVAHYQYMRTLPVVGKIFDSILEAGHSLPVFQVIHQAYFSKGFLLFITYEPVPESHEIFKRFANVFEQTYTRFLDLQKAEAQARESQIQLALERVRARTMAMQRSDELSETAYVLFQQFVQLGENPIQITIGIIKEEERIMEFRVTDWGGSGSKVNIGFDVSIDEPTLINKIFKAWKKNESSIVIELTGAELEGWLSYRNKVSGVNVKSTDTAGRRVISVAFFSKGMIAFSSPLPPVQESIAILERFANVFDLTYTRFLDLKKAEAQAREAQIEIGLERVRSRAMAMQSSEELNALIGTVFTELTKLDLALTRCIIWVFEPATDGARWWMANSEEPSNPMSFFIKYHEHPAYLTFVKEWKNQNVKFVYDLKGKDKIKWDKILFNETELKNLPDVVKNGMQAPERVLLSASFNNFGGINVASLEPLSEEHFEILLRFAKVFDLTYTRFLDLQKAEAQAREAQIEAGLERVRYSAMAMQSSEDVGAATAVVFNEISLLGVEAMRCGITIIHPDKTADVWAATTTSEGKEMKGMGTINFNNHPLWAGLFEAWKNKEENFSYALKGDDLKSYYKALANSSNYNSSYIQSQEFPEHFFYACFFEQGAVFTFSFLQHDDKKRNILKRFTAVFSLTFRRYLDLKQAEAQAREAQIEASLERVRSKTMAMHNSHDVGDTVTTMFSEFVHLGIHTNRCGILIFHDNASAEVWTARSNPEGKATLIIGKLNLAAHNMLSSVYKAWKAKKTFYQYDLLGDDLIHYYDAINKSEYYPVKFDINTLLSREFHSDFFFPEGAVFAFTNEPIAEEHSKIFNRFAGVFGQTYRRYLDLQKAEAQAREAQIEVSLERVRAKTMAMHNSEDVSAATATMFIELEKLGIENFRCGINHIKSNRTQEVWSVANVAEGKTVKAVGVFEIDAHPFWQQMYNDWMDKKEFVYYYLEGKEKEDYVKILNATPNYLSQPIREFPDIYFQIYFFGEGAVWAMSLQPHSEEDKQVMKRFASVFSLTFRRYQDLQKAEAQAREAQIEAALERVRSKTMAMHNSQDIAETVDILFQELTKLHVETLRCGISIIHDTGEMEVWTANPNADGKVSLTIGTLPMSIYPSLEGLFDAWKNKEPNFVYDLSGQDLVNYFTAINNAPDYPIRYDLVKLPPRQVINCFLFAEGALFVFTLQPLTSEANNIFKRFATLFGQTYRRYLDLQKAERLAREARIEATMEKVRARALAMQKADELIEVAQVLRNEMRLLGVEELETSSIYIHNEETGKTECWYAIKDEKKLVADHMMMDLNDTWVGREMLAFYRSDKKQISIPMRGDNRKEWINYCSEKSNLLDGFYGETIPDRIYHLYKFSNGYMGAASPGDISSESWDLLQRATAVFSLAYTRFSDLQQAEVAAKEAIKQAALDRIRADIASMRTLGDLNRIIPLIWNELTILGLPFIRCGVFIMDNEHQLIHTFLSTPEGKAIAAFHIPYDTPGKIRLIPENWKKKAIYLDHWDSSDFVDFAETLVKQQVITSSQQYLAGIPHGGFYLHFIPFLQGMLYVGNTIQLGNEEVGLIESVADAFSTAYARYEDFNKLEAAKKQVESTLNDLQTTQKQLIQSEKMASLGELTAGIAHEIQNPLNFVNNFSDVSTELLEEMKQELATGNLQQATELADDVIQNLEKILLHGKRADGIVKSMLQHSRASSGKKEPTDINALCDEYLRLSFHGLRAKDKTFNAKFETDFDKSIGKINIISQDVGRVILNLINNAFYAVSEKQKQAAQGLSTFQRLTTLYEPTVSISTKKVNGKVEIKVADNGNGIPQKVLDKIFQPFFTTKPTGQGTGLGLSLSYDIVKAHGGEIKVATKENEGTEFTIVL
jgi:signal transduction histidine kinase